MRKRKYALASFIVFAFLQLALLAYASDYFPLRAGSAQWSQHGLCGNTACVFDFKWHNVTVVVKNEVDAPVGNAFVRAFSPDWGVMYPHSEAWGVADSAGMYRFTLPTGNWVFIASSGWYAHTGCFLLKTRLT